jgi:hypothetical protein
VRLSKKWVSSDAEEEFGVAKVTLSFTASDFSAQSIYINNWKYDQRVRETSAWRFYEHNCL